MVLCYAYRLSFVIYGKEKSQVVGWYTIHLERGEQLKMLQVIQNQSLQSLLM